MTQGSSGAAIKSWLATFILYLKTPKFGFLLLQTTLRPSASVR